MINQVCKVHFDYFFFPQGGFCVLTTEKDKPARECGLKFKDIILLYANATKEHIDQLKVVEQYWDPSSFEAYRKSFEDYMRKSAESKKAIILVVSRAVSRAKQTTV